MYHLHHPLSYATVKNYINYINYFGPCTIFFKIYIVDEYDLNYVKNIKTILYEYRIKEKYLYLLLF